VTRPALSVEIRRSNSLLPEKIIVPFHHD
jgi:hypothetical protein